MKLFGKSKTRHDVTSVPMPWSYDSESNFTYMPPFIRKASFAFRAENIEMLAAEHNFTKWLIYGLTSEALDDWFDIYDPIDKETKITALDYHHEEAENLKLKSEFIRAYSRLRGFGAGFLFYRKSKEEFIALKNSLVAITRDIITDEITSVMILASEFANDENMNIMDAKQAWFEPIYADCIFHHFIKYSMCEGAAREGAKFLWIKTVHSNPDALQQIRRKFKGLSSRKGATTGPDILDLQNVVSNTLSGEFKNFLRAIREEIAMYSKYPADIMEGTSGGVVTGSEINVKGQYHAYKIIQNDALQYIIPLYKKYFKIDLTLYHIKWGKEYNLDEKGQAELDQLRFANAQLLISMGLTEEAISYLELKNVTAEMLETRLKERMPVFEEEEPVSPELKNTA